MIVSAHGLIDSLKRLILYQIQQYQTLFTFTVTVIIFIMIFHEYVSQENINPTDNIGGTWMKLHIGPWSPQEMDALSAQAPGSRPS